MRGRTRYAVFQHYYFRHTLHAYYTTFVQSNVASFIVPVKATIFFLLLHNYGIELFILFACTQARTAFALIVHLIHMDIVYNYSMIVRFHLLLLRKTSTANGLTRPFVAVYLPLFHLVFTPLL